MSLRKKFQATKISTISEQEKKVDAVMPKQNKRVGYLDIEEGSNTFRIFPSHHPEKSFFYPKTVHWLPQEVEMKDSKGNVVTDRSGKPKTEIKGKPIFNSRIHGGTKKDIIEEYMLFAEKTLTDECQDPEELKNKLSKLFDWKTGIKPKTSWVMYAKKMKFDVDGKVKSEAFGRLEVPTSVKDKMNELAADGGASGPVVVDPFTDPDDGKAISVNYDRDETPQNKYKVALLWKFDWTLTDEELEDFEKQEPLYKIFEKSYKRGDFEKALEGLRIFDEKNNFDLFEYSEWTEICEEVSAYYPEEDDDKDPSEDTDRSDDTEEDTDSSPQKGNLSADNEADALSEMSKEDLIQFIEDQKLEIRVMRTDTAETLRAAIREEIKFLQENSPKSEAEVKSTKSDEKNDPIDSRLYELSKEELTQVIKETNLQIRVMPKDTKETLIEAIESLNDLPWDQSQLIKAIDKIQNKENQPSATSPKDRMAQMRAKMGKSNLIVK